VGTQAEGNGGSGFARSTAGAKRKRGTGFSGAGTAGNRVSTALMRIGRFCAPFTPEYACRSRVPAKQIRRVSDRYASGDPAWLGSARTPGVTYTATPWRAWATLVAAMRQYRQPYAGIAIGTARQVAQVSSQHGMDGAWGTYGAFVARTRNDVRGDRIRRSLIR